MNDLSEGAVVPAARVARPGRGRAVDVLRTLGLPVFLLLLTIVIGILEPRFVSGANLQNLTRQGAVLAIMAFGQAFPILIGGLDISVGAQVALVAIVSALLSKSIGVAPAMLVGICAGGLIGLVNGTFIARFRLSPIIVTLGMLSVLRGASLVITDGQAVRNLPDGYDFLGTTKLGPVPLIALVAFLVFLVLWVVLTQTRMGRYTYAIGGNEEATRLSGVGVVRFKILAYVTTGLATGLAAVLLSSRVGSGEPNLGSGMELDAIAAVFIGGVAWGGGDGSLVGVLLGVVLLTMLSNGLTLVGVPSYIQSMVIGALIVAAVGADRLRRGSGT